MNVNWKLGMLLGGLAIGGGCAPALSTFTPAHVAPPGHVQLEMGTDVSYPHGAIQRLIDTSESLENDAETQPLTEAEQQALLDGAWSVAVSPPSIVQHFGAGVGVVDNLELQLRWAGGAWRGGARYQLLSEADHGIDFSSGLGVGRMKTDLSGLSLLDLVTFNDYVRWQFDVPMQFGQSGTWYRWWGGPRAMLVTYSADMSLSLPEIEAANYQGARIDTHFNGYGVYLGGQLGAAIGYQHAFLAAELTIVEFIGRANVDISGTDGLDDFRIKGSGLILVPGIGLMLEF